jgi:hypothetical protein
LNWSITNIIGTKSASEKVTFVTIFFSIYLCVWQPNKANYSQASKQQYKIKNKYNKIYELRKRSRNKIKSKRNIIQMYNMKPTEYGQRKVKRESNFSNVIQFP